MVGENLRKALDWLPQGRRLITIVTDCDLAGHVPNWPVLDALALREPDAAGLMDFYGRFGFKTELARLRGGSAAPAVALPKAGKKAAASATDDLFADASADVVDSDQHAVPVDPVATQYDTV